MPTFLESIGTRFARSRLGNALLAEERRSFTEAFGLMRNAYQVGPWLLPPQELLSQLQEQDPWMVYNLLDRTAWEIIGGYAADSSVERDRAVNESKRLYKYNPLAQWSIWLWTSWGLGDKVRVAVPDNEQANEAVQEFFAAGRNEPVLADDKVKENSRWLLVKGNRFYVFFTSTVDGETTVRTIDQAEVTLIHNPDDSKEVWFYKRTWTPKGGTSRTVYYPDWKTYFAEPDDHNGDVDERWKKLQGLGIVSQPAKLSWRDDETEIGSNDSPRTDAYIMFVPHNIKDEDELWGWPLLTNPRAWMQAHQHLMESRLTLAEARSMFVRRKKYTGGSRAGKAIANTIASNLSRTQWTDTNPPAVAGAVEIDNAMIETEDLPLTTAASDTAQDNQTFSWMALLGAGLFPTSAGLDTSRWATALEMDKAQSMLFEEYRGFWSAQFRKIATVVLLAYEKHGKKSYGEYTITVSIDTFSLADFPAIAKTLGQFTKDTITPLVELGTISASAATAILTRFYRMALDALGIEDAGDLTSDEAFGLDQEPEQEESGVAGIARLVAENFKAGKIDQQQLLEWAIGVGFDAGLEQADAGQG